MDGGEIRVPFKLTFTKVKKKRDGHGGTSECFITQKVEAGRS
jgi:hypothetical protein